MRELTERLGLPDGGGQGMDSNHAAIALALAMDRAREELAGREGARVDATAKAVARLEALRRKLQPLYAAIPRDVESFDLGLVSHDRPRLFVDMVGYVEMSGDQTGYRLVQETRRGRAILAEASDDAAMCDHVTVYVARRLVERERVLPDKPTMDAPPARSPAEAVAAKSPPQGAGAAPPAPAASPAAPMTAEEAFRRWTRTPVQEPPAGSMRSPAAAEATAATVRSLVDPQAPARETGPEQTAATRPAASMEAPRPQGPAPAAETVAEPVAKKEPATAHSQPAEAEVRRWPAAAPARHSRGWWVWPVLALFFGGALGAAGLYLYAESLTR